MVKLLRKLSDKGASLTEYALLVSLIAVICLVAVSATGGNIQALLSETSMATSNLTVYGPAPAQPGAGESSIPVGFTVGSTLTAQIAAPSEIPFTAECKGDGGDSGKATKSYAAVAGTEGLIDVPITADSGQTYSCTVNGVPIDGTGGDLGGASGNSIAITGLTFTSGTTDITATFTATPEATNGYTLTCNDGVSFPAVIGASSPVTLTGLTPSTAYDCSLTPVSPDTSPGEIPETVTTQSAAPVAYSTSFDGFSGNVNGQTLDGYAWYGKNSASFSGGNINLDASNLRAGMEYGFSPTSFSAELVLSSNASGTTVMSPYLYMMNEPATWVNSSFVEGIDHMSMWYRNGEMRYQNRGDGFLVTPITPLNRLGVYRITMTANGNDIDWTVERTDAVEPPQSGTFANQNVGDRNLNMNAVGFSHAYGTSSTVRSLSVN